MPFDINGYPQHGAPKPRRSSSREKVALNVPSSQLLNSTAPDPADPRLPIIAAKDEDGKIERRLATPEEHAALKAGQRGRPKKAAEKPVTTFVPEE